jgi:mannitol 2-dehydrogenase
MTQLSLATLSKLKVPTPKYARADLKGGIIHIGVGNFHRAHLAVYLDALFNLGLDHDWALIGAGVMDSDQKMKDVLKAQDYLSTVVEQEKDASTARVTGPMVDFISPSDKQALISKMADPAIRIVSLTITEGGYMIDPATGKFDPSHPALVKDAKDPAHPSSVFGLILAGLSKRRAAGVPPFTVMSCDNVPHNGVVTRNAVAGLAELFDKDLAKWVRETVAFPNAMVDRITPATTDRERKIASEQFGIEDGWPVFCEQYIQWVIEDNFPLGRPRWEEVGATFVSDVTPYEYMKIRILNGGHAVIAYPGGLLDVHFVHEAMEHPLIKAFLDKVEQDEIIPTVPPVPNTNLQDYYKLIVRRFSNPKIGDTIRRLAFDGSNRQPKFIVPPIADRLKAGKSVAGLALESALWCRKIIDPNDPSWDKLRALAQKAKSDPLAWLSMRDVYGDVVDSDVFKKSFSDALTSLWNRGTEATLKAYLA